MSNVHVYRRKENLVDMFIERYPGAESYNVKAAPNWDQAFVTFASVPSSGLVSPSLRGPGHAMAYGTGNNVGDRVRFLFDPEDYALTDENVLFLSIAPVVNTVEQANGPLIILLSAKQYSETSPLLILRGIVPVAADITGALNFRMPASATTFVVSNLESTGPTLYLAMGTGPTEIPIAAGDKFNDNRNYRGGTFTLRSEGTSAEVLIHTSLATGRT